MVARIGIQCLENDGQDVIALVGDERDDVFIVPQEQGTLRNLEMWAAYAARDLRTSKTGDECVT